MKEDDIDKIFRDTLADQKAPTTESDWAAFEGMLNSRAGGSSKWTAVIALLILLTGSVSAYYFLSEPEARYTSREQISSHGLNQEYGLKSEKPGETELIESREKFEEIDRNEKGELTDLKESKPDELQSEISERTSSGTINSPGPLSTQINAKSDSDQPKGSVNRESERAQESHLSSGSKATISTADNLQKDHSDILDKSEGVKEPVNNINSNKTSPPIAGLRSAGSNSVNSQDETELEKLKKLTLLDASTSFYQSPDLIDEKRKIEPIKKQLFVPFIYSKLERNSVLKTTPAIGVGIERSFPLEGKGALALQAAIGYQRTGRLNWNQTSQNVVYGFDRYVNESNLQTDNLDMVQVPIRLSYQYGVHRIFAGAEINWVVNASQEFRESSEGIMEDGYLYDSGAPNTSLFFQIGYGYALNEKLQLDLGLNTADSDWEPADKRPIGGFIRLNYFVR